MMAPVKISQIELVAAIFLEIGKQHPGLKVDTRLINAVTQGANLIVAEFAKDTGAGGDVTASNEVVRAKDEV